MCVFLPALQREQELELTEQYLERDESDRNLLRYVA